MALTINQISHRLTTWFENHAQINTVVFGSESKFDGLSNVVYPAVNIEYLQSNRSGRMMERTYKVIVFDMIDPANSQTLNDVHSDTMQIIDDFFSFLTFEYEWSFARASTITPYNDETGDRCAGHWFNITLATPMPQSTCSTPLKT